MIRRGQTKVYKVEPDLILLRQIMLPLPWVVCQLSDDFFKLCAHVELVVLCTFTNWSWLQELGDGPLPKRDPSSPDIARRVPLLAQIGVKFFNYSPYPWLSVLAQLLPALSLYFFLKWLHQLLETFFFHKALHGQMLLESFCSLIGVEGPNFSFFHHHICLLRHNFEGRFLAFYLYPFS